MVRSRISCFKRSLVFVCVVPLLFLGMCQTFVFGGLAKVEDRPDYFLFSNRWGGRGFEERRRMAKPTLHG